jgi:hypothetical protein
MSAVTTSSFDEVMQKIKTRVPPPRTDAQARAASAPVLVELEREPEEPTPLPAPAPSRAIAAPEPVVRGESASVKRWFKPPVAVPRTRTKKVCFEVDEQVAARFKKLCFLQEVEQRKVVEQLLQGYLAANER